METINSRVIHRNNIMKRINKKSNSKTKIILKVNTVAVAEIQMKNVERKIVMNKNPDRDQKNKNNNKK